MNLTNEEIRIKVAEAMGWVQIWKRQCGHNFGAPGALDWVGREKEGGVEYVLPNYPADLNAAHEMENSLTDEQHVKFRVMLAEVVQDVKYFCRKYTSATARQRCLAYLKTKGILP